MSDIDKLKKKIEEHEKRIKALEGMPIKQAVGKDLSLKEFLLDLKPSDEVKSTLAVGYFLEHYKSMESFNVKELASAFRSAKEPPPKNINDKINKNIRNGHMMEAEEKKDNTKAWTLTSKGEKFIKNGLKGE